MGRLKGEKQRHRSDSEVKEVNGWNIPSGMSWTEFCDMREACGLPRPKPRKALFLTEIEKGNWNLYETLRKTGKYSDAKWKNNSDLLYKPKPRRSENPVKYSRPNIPLEGIPNARLTENEVREIYLALLNGESQSSLGRKYDVSGKTIHTIHKKKNWKEFTDKIDEELKNEQKV